MCVCIFMYNRYQLAKVGKNCVYDSIRDNEHVSGQKYC